MGLLNSTLHDDEEVKAIIQKCQFQGEMHQSQNGNERATVGGPANYGQSGVV
jgi:hypothetical protein